jgi:cell shape-determining protein MreC
MPSLEDALVTSAGGDFGLVLLAFLVVALVGSFLWAIRKVLDQNQAFNRDILKKMDEIVQGMKEYKKDTCDTIKEHDRQAKEIQHAVNRIEITLDNRPCVAGTNGSREL